MCAMALIVTEIPDGPRTRVKSSKAKLANFLLGAAKVGCEKDKRKSLSLFWRSLLRIGEVRGIVP